MVWGIKWAGAARRACGHESLIVTKVAGLERTVCEGCGNVSVRYLYDVLQKSHATRQTEAV